MARILKKTTEITHEEWLELRRTGIGGSDSSTICGLNPYSSHIALWADKTGRMPAKEDNEAMRIGRDLEEYVAKRFTEATGKKVRRRNAIFQHDTYDFITANIDREVIGENAGLECKTTSLLNKSDFEGGQIPLTYLCQCRHYMNVMGYEKMYLAVLVMGKAFYWYEIPYDTSEGDALLKMEIDFWETYIKPDVRPEPDGSDSAAAVLQALFDKQRENTITMFEQEDVAAQLTEIKQRKKALEAEENKLQQELIAALDGNTEGLTEHFKVSWKEQSRTTPDGKLLKQMYPDVFQQVAKTSSYRVFRIAERK